MPNELNISLVQLDIQWEDMELNFRRIEGLVEANQFAADLILLPEMFNTGFTMHPERRASDATNLSVINWMKALSAQKQATVAGSIAYHGNGKFYNRLLVVSPTGLVSHYNKRHLFRMAGEHKVYASGEERVIVKVGEWRVALFVCYDLRFPVWSRNLNQYDMAIYVANWPHKRQEVWQTLLKARAMENQCFVAGVNRVGKDPSEYYSGYSALIDFRGQVLNKSKNDRESVVNQTIYLNELNEFRMKFPAWMDADGFDITD
jgi:predicted amidohydrolase